MTRTEVLAQYRPIRAGIRRVLREAAKACGRADLDRAVKQVAPWAEAAELEEADTAEMLVDVALFEPNLFEVLTSEPTTPAGDGPKERGRRSPHSRKRSPPRKW